MGIERFLAAATGPARLREALRAQTTPVRTLYRALAAVDTLQTRVPRAVLGGDLLDVLSERLQRYLLEPGPPGPQALAPGGRASFPALPAPSRPPGMASASPPRASSPRTREAGQPPATRPAATFEAAPAGPRYEAEAARQGVSPAAARAPSPSGAVLPGPEGRAPGGAGRLSPLVARLDAYERHSSQPPSTTHPPPGGFGWPPAVARPGRLGASMPTQGLAPHRAWPDDTGAQLARVLQPAADGPDRGVSARRVQQTVQTSAPERVEVQNVFNVEVHTHGDAADETLADLSEKIADILREQAIQHGIDLS